MSWLTKAIAWIICLLLIITNLILCIQLWSLYEHPSFEEDENNSDEIEDIEYEIMWNFLDEFRANNSIILCLAILTILITITLVTLTLILRKQLSQLKLLFDEAVVCIKQLSGISVAPTIAQINMILLILLSGYTLLCLTTAKYPMFVSTWEPFKIFELNEWQHLRLPYQIEYVDSKTIRSTFWIYIIGLLWTIEFIFAFEEFCIGAAVVFWYFKPSIYQPSQHAVKILVKYHLGTIAKGSAFITLLKVPRFLLVCISKRLV
ncbi:choline transporter-like 1 [Episyrphus balteatus]|uniref:choline transporter-like 1 n=1 Tax=Episyrphus balteatus TaxID=286459 RepID=UPI00248576BE|nr:choline transporter-like 1 [Episyrphus balteatus]